MNYENTKRTLKENVCIVTFTKKDGTDRTMKCTLKSDLLPAIVEQSETEKKERAENTSVLAVFDLEADGWRSFRLDSVKTLTIA